MPEDLELLPLYYEVQIAARDEEREPSVGWTPDGFGLPPEGALATAPVTASSPSFDHAVQRVIDMPAVVTALRLRTIAVAGLELDLVHAHTEHGEVHIPATLRRRRCGPRRHAEVIVQPWSSTRSQVWLRSRRSPASPRWFDIAHDVADAARRQLGG